MKQNAASSMSKWLGRFFIKGCHDMLRFSGPLLLLSVSIVRVLLYLFIFLSTESFRNRRRYVKKKTRKSIWMLMLYFIIISDLFIQPADDTAVFSLPFCRDFRGIEIGVELADCCQCSAVWLEETSRCLHPLFVIIDSCLEPGISEINKNKHSCKQTLKACSYSGNIPMWLNSTQIVNLRRFPWP